MGVEHKPLSWLFILAFSRMALSHPRLIRSKHINQAKNRPSVENKKDMTATILTQPLLGSVL